MRTRNIKINVFLNDDEKKLLMDKSKKAKLSQSDFIRSLIKRYYDLQPTQDDVNNVITSLSTIIDNLALLKRQMDFLRYSDYSNFIDKQIENINEIIIQIKDKKNLIIY